MTEKRRKQVHFECVWKRLEVHIGPDNSFGDTLPTTNFCWDSDVGLFWEEDPGLWRKYSWPEDPDSAKTYWYLDDEKWFWEDTGTKSSPEQAWWPQP